MKNINETLRSHIANNSHFDYDSIRDLLANDEDEIFDVFVRLAFELSKLRLDTKEHAIARELIAQLARDAFDFNCEQAEEDDFDISAH